MTEKTLTSESISENSESNLEAHTGPKFCRYCFENIHCSAKVCHHCGRHQSRFWQYFHIGQIGLLVSILMVAIAFFQLEEARNERVNAASALTRATQAEKKASLAAKSAEKAEQNIKVVQEALSRQALLLTSVTWLHLETKSEFGTERAKKAADQILADLDSLIVSAIPDPNERRQWVQNLRESIPMRR